MALDKLAALVEAPSGDVEEELVRVVHECDRAMARNDPDAIARLAQ
jgi:hypothetical protein